jgi:hypothetical protein
MTDEYLSNTEKKKPPRNSPLGIASFALGVFTIFLLALGVYIALECRYGCDIDITPFIILAGLFLSLVAPLIGLGLGIAALRQRDSRILFAHIGVYINGFILFIYISIALA